MGWSCGYSAADSFNGEMARIAHANSKPLSAHIGLDLLAAVQHMPL